MKPFYVPRFALKDTKTGRYLSKSGNPVCEELGNEDVNKPITFGSELEACGFVADLDEDDPFTIFQNLEIVRVIAPSVVDFSK
jgi:hypothetical protein